MAAASADSAIIDQGGYCQKAMTKQDSGSMRNTRSTGRARSKRSGDPDQSELLPSRAGQIARV